MSDRKSDPNFVILYVDKAEASAAFYAGLLGREPVAVSPGFAMFQLSSGLTLGLWTRDDVAPGAKITGGGNELCFPIADDAALDVLHDEWHGRGLKILQAPTDLGFGRTFVAADPDGHRLRPFVRQAQ